MQKPINHRNRDQVFIKVLSFCIAGIYMVYPLGDEVAQITHEVSHLVQSLTDPEFTHHDHAHHNYHFSRHTGHHHSYVVAHVQAENHSHPLIDCIRAAFRFQDPDPNAQIQSQPTLDVHLIPRLANFRVLTQLCFNCPNPQSEILPDSRIPERATPPPREEFHT